MYGFCDLQPQPLREKTNQTCIFTFDARGAARPRGNSPPPFSATESSKTGVDAPRKEVEQAKPDVAPPEATAQRKLADAEAALKTAKEEAEQTRAEAERAKADAKAARNSETAAKRKLADAEAARAATEKAWRAGLGLRKWFRRPASKNH
jgi:hypothetical protein